MNIFKHFSNGIALIIIAAMHTNFCLSADGYGRQFKDFSDKYFFRISEGFDAFPTTENTDFAGQSAFWFF
jgi:hypothetical protein